MAIIGVKCQTQKSAFVEAAGSEGSERNQQVETVNSNIEEQTSFRHLSRIARVDLYRPDLPDLIDNEQPLVVPRGVDRPQRGREPIGHQLE